MAWNKPNATHPQPTKKDDGAKRSLLRGSFAGIIVVSVAAVVALVLLSDGDEKPKASGRRSSSTINESKPAGPKKESKSDRVKRISAELKDQVREYIKKPIGTNELHFVHKKMDKNDPDRALKTQVARDVGELLAIRPGERVPSCLPFGFMIEETSLEMASADGAKVIEMDGGNKRFLESLKKWKVTIKDSDTEDRVAQKMQLVDAQLELLQGIDEGTTVNDALRAAYDFRVKAYEKRQDLIRTISELHKDDPDVETTRELVRRANTSLADDGIIPIHMENVIRGYYEDEQTGGKDEVQ